MQLTILKDGVASSIAATVYNDRQPLQTKAFAAQFEYTCVEPETVKFVFPELIENRPYINIDLMVPVKMTEPVGNGPTPLLSALLRSVTPDYDYTDVTSSVIGRYGTSPYSVFLRLFPGKYRIMLHGIMEIHRESLSKERIRELAVDNGFTLREQPDGEQDLNPYVYKFVEALLKEVAQ